MAFDPAPTTKKGHRRGAPFFRLLRPPRDRLTEKKVATATRKRTAPAIAGYPSLLRLRRPLLGRLARGFLRRLLGSGLPCRRLGQWTSPLDREPRIGSRKLL